MTKTEHNHQFLNELKNLGVFINFEDILSVQYSRFIKKDSLIIDVGGHSGLHTNRIKELITSGKILFIEPLDFIVDKSIFNKNVVYFNCAVSNYIGNAEFILAEGTPQESGFKERIYNNPSIANPKRIKVNVTTIDDIMINYSSCDYIKIDTEGSELLCIDGAIKTINKYRPIISIEYGYPSYSVYGLTYKNLWDKCIEIDYSIYDIFLNKIDSLDLWRKICDLSTWGFFLIPNEKTLKNDF